MQLSGEDIIDMIIKKNKVGEMLNLIELEKRQVIENYNEHKKERCKWLIFTYLNVNLIIKHLVNLFGISKYILNVMHI